MHGNGIMQRTIGWKPALGFVKGRRWSFEQVGYSLFDDWELFIEDRF